MAETHYFNTYVAELYGVNCAVILQNLWHWIRKNEANGTNFYDGRYWTYNSTKAFTELFPYLTQRQIEIALKKLRDEDIIIVGNYGENKYIRTLWYAITDKGESILRGREMDSTKKGNANHAEAECITNNKHNSKTTVNKPDAAMAKGSGLDTATIEAEFDELWKQYPRKEGRKNALQAYKRARKNGVTFEEVQSGIVKYAGICKGREKRYIKQGSTWFNGECWNDEIESGADTACQGSFDTDQFYEAAVRQTFGYDFDPSEFK